MHETKLWKHFASYFYDIFPVLGVLLLTNLLVLFARDGVEVPANTLWFSFLIFFEIGFYYIHSWKIGGQTLGMRAWKIKIVSNSNSDNITYIQATLRFVTGIISSLMLGLGLFWKLFSKKNLSWMDMVSQTSTINTE